MSGGVVSDVQAQTEDEWLYVWYNTDANIVKCLWNECMWAFVFFKNGTDSNHFSRKNRTRSCIKSVVVSLDTKRMVYHIYNNWLNFKFYCFSAWIINEFYKCSFQYGSSSS